MNTHLWLCLPFEESVMQLLIIDVDLSHLRAHTFTHFGLQCFLILFLLQCLPHLHNASGLDKIWQIKWRLFYTTFPLQVLTFKAPVTWYRYCVPCCLQNIFTINTPLNINVTMEYYNCIITFTLRLC